MELYLKVGVNCENMFFRKEDWYMEYIRVFIVGGALCAIVQIFMDKTKLMPGRIMTLVVCIGSILSAIGVYAPFVKWAHSGASVPLLGFGHTLYQGVKNSVDKEGFLGLFKGGLSEAAVGISAALIFGYIISLLFKSKMES